MATESKRITVTERASAVARTGVGKASTHLLAVRDCDRGRYAAGKGVGGPMRCFHIDMPASNARPRLISANLGAPHLSRLPPEAAAARRDEPDRREERRVAWRHSHTSEQHALQEESDPEAAAPADAVDGQNGDEDAWRGSSG